MKIITKQHSRTDLAKMFGELGFKYGAEIGVKRGNFSAELCIYIKSLEKLYSVDPWDLVFEDPASHRLGVTGQERTYRQAWRRLRYYPACEIVRKTSLEAVRDIEYESLDFVYIDGSHTFDYVMTDIIEWSKRVRKGGIVSGNGYKPTMFEHVVFAVDTYVQAHRIKALNLMDPKEGDDYPLITWWFTKQ